MAYANKGGIILPRPTKPRRICEEPAIKGFAPEDTKLKAEVITMSVDELEAIRLIDIEGISQEECALRINVARTTAQAIYNSARTKTAKCLVYGYELQISGGNYEVCNGQGGCCACGKTAQ